LITIPLKNLADALTHASGELSTVTPPNPNAKHFAQNGFKPFLQYIYESAAKSHQSEDTQDTTIAKDATLFKDALQRTSAGIVVMDAEGEIKLTNNSAPITVDTDGVKHLELLFEQEGELHDWLAHVKDSQVHAEKLWQRVPNKITGEEGRRIFDICATFEKGSNAEVVLVLFDQTGMYQPEDDALDFIAFAAHELRGPITVIRGYLDVLGMETEALLQPDQQELLKRLVVSANRLSGYINNILNASRYDRRHLQLHLTEDTIAGVYDTINDDMQLRASSQNRLLGVAIPPDLPSVAADRSSLSEVIGNLIDNGLKYSNEGGAVNVTATTEGDFIKVIVEDHGIGIPVSVIGNLFHKFYRSHRSRETVAGTGIGLYICKAIIESHGGKIGVTSAEGQGSTFWFTVPIYATVKDKLLAGGNLNTGANMISTGGSWIKNHSMYNG
jgi:signal transduction histidine kinase